MKKLPLCLSYYQWLTLHHDSSVDPEDPLAVYRQFIRELESFDLLLSVTAGTPIVSSRPFEHGLETW